MRTDPTSYTATLAKARDAGEAAMFCTTNADAAATALSESRNEQLLPVSHRLISGRFSSLIVGAVSGYF
jgi:hypothetical protein